MVRKLALVTCIAILAGLPIPMWKATRNLFAGPPVTVVVWIAVAIAYVFSAILPLFYFAMWRNQGDVRVTKERRWVCLVGILAGAIVITTQFPVRTVETALSMAATLACVVLLIALFSGRGEVSQVSGFPGAMTLAARIGGGLWLAINLGSLALNLREGALLTLLDQVCLFAAPFAVARH